MATVIESKMPEEVKLSDTDNHVAKLNTLIEQSLDMFGWDIVRSLKRHFCDSCSHVDSVINRVLKMIEEIELPQEFISAVSALVKEEDSGGEDEYGTIAVLYIIDVLEDWIEKKKMTPDPWWAD